MNRPDGPLASLRVIELDSIGGVPFAAMALADMGASVVRVVRPSRVDGSTDEPLTRGKAIVPLDLKGRAERLQFLELVEHADVLLEGFRPGAMEGLALGPAECLRQSPQLVYGRLTGWGQRGGPDGRPAYDINMIGLSGALQAMGHGDRPPRPPLNLVCDFAGGGLLMAVAVLAAVRSATETGAGCVIDHSMIEGTSLLMTQAYERLGAGEWNEERGTNLSDGSAPFYTTYSCRDGRTVSVAALSDESYIDLCEMLQLRARDVAERWAVETWPGRREEFAQGFEVHPRDHWVDHRLANSANVFPVLDLAEVPHTEAARRRASFYEADGSLLPSPTPVFSTSPRPTPGRAIEMSAREAIAGWTRRRGEIDRTGRGGEGDRHQ